MGEYYKCVILNSRKRNVSNTKKILATIKPWDFDNGAKLMEWGYINNDVTKALEALINRETGVFAGKPIVIAGDYDDDEPNTFKGEKVNLYFLSDKVGEKITENWLKLNKVEPKHYRYIINETKGVYIDTYRVEKDDWGCRIHPLPILCCDDEAKGLGSYNGKNQRMMGSWRRNVVTVSDNKPDGMREVFYRFRED